MEYITGVFIVGAAVGVVGSEVVNRIRLNISMRKMRKFNEEQAKLNPFSW